MTEPSVASEKQPSTETVSFANFLNRAILQGAGAAGLFGYVVMASVALSTVHPLLDLASHTSWHMFWGLSAVALVLVLGCCFSHAAQLPRWRIRTAFIIVPWLYFGWVAQPWVSLPLVSNDAQAKGLKIYSWNIWIGNQELDAIVDHVLEQKADVVVIIELGPQQMEVLERLDDHFAERIWLPDGASGIAVLSKIPGTRFQAIHLGRVAMPAISASIPQSEKSQACSLLAVHTRSPDFHPYRTRERDRQLAAIGEWADTETTPSIVIGDLNITPWSKPFQTMLRSGKLIDTRDYRGYMGTWPAQLRFAGVPIDHALVSESIKVLYRSVDPFLSPSDHRAITLIVE